MLKTIKIIGPAYPYRGGIATTNERLVQEFMSMGFDVDIETFIVQYPSFLFPGKTQYNEKSAPENLDIKRSVNSINPFNNTNSRKVSLLMFLSTFTVFFKSV